MFDGAMGVMSISNSYEQMEKILFDQDPKGALKSIQYFIKDCEANTKRAQQSAVALSETQVAEVNGLTKSLESLAVSSVGSTVLSDMIKQSE
jgi:hypothetical protein